MQKMDDLIEGNFPKTNQSKNLITNLLFVKKKDFVFQLNNCEETGWPIDF